MRNSNERDWVRTLGTVLIIIGVSMWGVYAIGKYLLGWQITDRDFLPYHLAAIIPGMILKYHRSYSDIIKKRILRRGNKGD
ncbi:MAG: hypothetical protein EPN94_09135 [Nitrospirae bacterium]|nr:MAG: hypothetical protein EPN94_09135 [Nitrospirota bacterium]